MKLIISLISFKKNKDTNKNHTNILLKIILILKLIKICIFACSINQPFNKGGNCVDTCSLQEIKSHQCILSNEIIEVQWLNNIIYLGDIDYRYIGIESSENDDLLVEVSSFPNNNMRVFYGLTKEGKGFFKKGDQETVFYQMEINDNETRGRFESEIFTFKLDSSSDDRIYLLSFSKGNQFVEVYDFYQEKSYFKTMYTCFETTNNVYQKAAPHFKIKKKNTNIYFLGLLSYDHTDRTNYFYLRSVKFQYLNINENNPVIFKKNKIEYSDSLMVSCFETKSNYIMCFIKDDNNEYTVVVYSEELEKKQSLGLGIINANIDDFFKCIHFYDEVGVFAFYQNGDNSIFIIFKEYNPSGNEIKAFSLFTDIKIDGHSFQRNLMSNDIIKIIDKKFYYAVISQDNNFLYISTIHNYKDISYVQRVYEINAYNLYKYKFIGDIRIAMYNNFLCLVSNFKLEEESDVRSSLMIFSYPNSTNVSLSISDYLLTHNNNKINNLTLALNGRCSLENNIFGLIPIGIKFIENSNVNDNIYLSSLSNKKITKDDLIKSNEVVKIIAPLINNTECQSFEYKFKYACVVTEPDYEEFNSYTVSKIENGPDSSVLEKDYFGIYKTHYIGKYSIYNIILEETLTENCNIKYCKLCYKNSANECLSCEYEYNILSNNFKECYNIYSNLLKNTYYANDMNISQIEQINSVFKNELINSNYTGDNIIIQAGNVAFQLCSLEYQKNQINKNLSNIDLGECEIRLVRTNNLNDSKSLIILKNDIKILNKTATYVYYEVYNSKDKKQLSLDVCKDTLIEINTPVTLDEETAALLSELDKTGYDIFDKNDPFYNDICTKYTSGNGTDVTLTDRKIDIYNKTGNKKLCQENCQLVSYNIETGKAKCNCAVKTNAVIPDLINMIGSNRREIYDSFFDSLSNSNFLLLKCYKNAFDFSNFFQNIGRIIMSLILLGLIVNCIIYIVKDRKKLKTFCQSFLKEKSGVKPPKKDESKKQKIASFNKKSTYTKLHSPEKKKNKKSKIQKTDYSKNLNSSVNRIKVLNKSNKNIKSNKDINIDKKEKKSLPIKVKNKNIISNKKNDKSKNKEKNDFKYEDQELNDLDYKTAIKKDKRTYLQYYWCLLKKKHIILFTFLPVKDYNLLSLKLSLFLFSFSLYFAINGFFFNDNTMHKIYIENGDFNFIYQLPVTIYSTLISALINMILKTLAITESYFLTMKKEKNIEKFMRQIRNIMKVIKIKIIIFFCLSFLLMLFLWYFISCFCSIYHNTQKILIKDTLITFSMSMLYPFGINLIPGIFRISALKAKKRDKELLYRVSKVLALL
jgi:hypothetical protein